MSLLLLLNPITGETPIQILPDASFEMSDLEVANKVFVAVSNSSPLVVGSATNTVTDPTYANSPREMLILVDTGDAAYCNTVAAAQLALRQEQRKKLTGLPVRLRDGLAIERGQVVRILIPRADIDLNLPVRRIEHDFGANPPVTIIDVGDFASARDDADAVLALAQNLDKLAKETAL